MEVGCTKNAGASTLGSQLLHGDCSHGRLLLVTKPRALTQKGKTGTRNTDKTVRT